MLVENKFLKRGRDLLHEQVALAVNRVLATRPCLIGHVGLV